MGGMLKRYALGVIFASFALMSQAQSVWSAKETVRQMSPGWNLGNTLEAGSWDANFSNKGLGTETSWQPTRTSQCVIDFVKSQGYRSVRIPCAWVMGHIVDKDKYTISPQWMQRVKQVVDYCISADLYVVLNQHWDGGWLENHIADSDPEVVAKNKVILNTIWTQIAEAFKDYDEHLVFAGLNEPNAGTADAVRLLVEYEQVFIDAVRATGGNNAERVLIVQGPNTDIEATAKMMTKMPVDVVPDRLMLEVHYYTPWNFAGMEKDESWGKMAYYWGAGNHHAGSSHNSTWGEEATMCELLGKMKTFADKGYPVYIGEVGALWRDLSALTGESQAKHDASIRSFFAKFTGECFKNGFAFAVWDHNNLNYPNMTIIDRSKCAIFNSPAHKGIMDVTDAVGIAPLKAEASP